MKALAAVLLILGRRTFTRRESLEQRLSSMACSKKLKSEGTLDAPNTISGKANNVIASQLVQSTTTIKAAVGTTFGILVKLFGEPGGAVVTSHFRCIHPKLTDPASGRSSETDDWESPRPIGTPRYVSYTFDRDWELVAGRWTIQVMSDGKILAEKTFEVIPP